VLRRMQARKMFPEPPLEHIVNGLAKIHYWR
jgi:hypothetical protein